MNIYENTVILDPALSEEEIKSAIDKITDLITNSDGEILKIDNWGKKKLAYELNKQKMGTYVLFLFKAPPSVIKKIESYFKVFDPAIKFMVIKLNKKQIAATSADVLGIPAIPQEEESPQVQQPAAEGAHADVLGIPAIPQEEASPQVQQPAAEGDNV